MILEKQSKAYQLGYLASAQGKDAIPALDGELLKLLEGLQPGDGALNILNAWVQGYIDSPSFE